MKLNSLKKSLMLICFLAAFLCSVVTAIVSLVSMKQASDFATDEYVSAMEEGYNEKIKCEIQSAIAVIQYEYDQYQAGIVTEEQAKMRAKETIRNMRYGENEDGYFWIDSVDYTLIMHPILSEDEGKNREELKDQNGVMIIQEIMKKVKEDEKGGFNQFCFTKSDGVTVAPKVAYSRMFEPWQWVVSTGNYVDDMKQTTQTVEDRMQEKFQTISIIVIVFAVLVSMVTIVTSYFQAKKIVKPVSVIQEFAGRLADGDMTTPVIVKENNEIGKVAIALNEAQNKMHTLLSQIMSVTNKINDTIKECNRSYTSMRESIHEVSGSVDSISQNIATQADSTTSATQNVKYITDAIETTNQEVNGLDDSMHKLGRQSLTTLDDLVKVNTRIKEDIGIMSKQMQDTNESVENIQIVVELINKISSQTNLLSLNASIEAAKAGEQGQGFSVVAKEIGSLAEQSTQAVERIEHNILELMEKSKHSLKIMEAMDQTVEEQVATLKNTQKIFTTLYSDIDHCIDSVDRIHNITDEMQKHSGSISDALEILNELAQGNAANAEESYGLAEEMEGNVETVSQIMEELSLTVDSLVDSMKRFQI